MVRVGLHVYTMDNEVVPRCCKSIDWLLNSSLDYFGLHQGKKCQSDHGGRGSQKIYFKAYIIHLHNPTGFVIRDAKEAGW